MRSENCSDQRRLNLAITQAIDTELTLNSRVYSTLLQQFHE